MAGYSIIALGDMISQLGEQDVMSMLSKFSCPLNKDVEYFIKKKATEFEKHRISKTHIVYASYKSSNVLAGYFTLANKAIFVRQGILSKTLQKRVAKFGTYARDRKGYTLAAPLIAQLGKNFDQGFNKLITGDELLKLACDSVAEAQSLIGGKLVYIECEDKPELTEFYERNGFCNFDKRPLDNDEKTLQHGQYLIQLIKYLSSGKPDISEVLRRKPEAYI